MVELAKMNAPGSIVDGNIVAGNLKEAGLEEEQPGSSVT